MHVSLSFCIRWRDLCAPEWSPLDTPIVSSLGVGIVYVPSCPVLGGSVFIWMDATYESMTTSGEAFCMFYLFAVRFQISLVFLSSSALGCDHDGFAAFLILLCGCLAVSAFDIALCVYIRFYLTLLLHWCPVLSREHLISRANKACRDPFDQYYIARAI